MDDTIVYSLQDLGNFLLSNRRIPYGNNIMKQYSFKEPLIEGTILTRPNRFIMLVVLNGKKIFAQCPATGRIGNIVFENVPCLLSKADNPKRKTKHTVEAIWLDELTSKKMDWHKSKCNKSLYRVLSTKWRDARAYETNIKHQ
jgi:hypothetical protein